MKGREQQFVVVVHADAETIAVLELDRALAIDDAGAEAPGAVLDVIDLADPGEFAHRS